MIDFLKSLLFVRKCLICGTVLDYVEKGAVFCPKCRLEYEKLGRAVCKMCGNREKDCHCLPERLRGEISASAHLFAFESELSKTIVYSLKHKDVRALQDFLAGELSDALVRSLGGDLSEYAITFAPRKPKSVREYGFDQAEALAEKIAERLHLPMEDMFVHARRSALQKTLNAEQREENAKKSYSLRRGFVPETDKLIIVDDVMTTGSTLASLVSLAKTAGYREVVVTCVAKTTHSKT